MAGLHIPDQGLAADPDPVIVSDHDLDHVIVEDPYHVSAGGVGMHFLGHDHAQCPESVEDRDPDPDQYLEGGHRVNDPGLILGLVQGQEDLILGLLI